MTSPIDVEQALSEWGQAAREQAAATGSAQTPIAVLLRGTPHRRRLSIAAAAAVTVAVSLAAVLLAAHRPDHHTSTAPILPPPSTTIPCAQDFAVESVSPAPHVGYLAIRLSYRGHSDCLLGSGPPGLLLVSSRGVVFGSREQLARLGGYHPPKSPRTVLVRHGEMVSFKVFGFHDCLSTPSDSYTLRVALDTSAPPTTSRGIAVPIGHLEPSSLLCLTAGLGAAKPVTVAPEVPTAHTS